MRGTRPLAMAHMVVLSLITICSSISGQVTTFSSAAPSTALTTFSPVSEAPSFELAQLTTHNAADRMVDNKFNGTVEAVVGDGITLTDRATQTSDSQLLAGITLGDAYIDSNAKTDLHSSEVSASDETIRGLKLSPTSSTRSLEPKRK